jgi:chorismate-pyruvate lyase
LATALERAGGTVTDLLESVSGERIDALVVAQARGRAGLDSRLGLRPLDPVLERAALLAGHETGRVFAYAESQIAADRLSDDAVRRLLECRDPIGRILTEGGLDPHRQFLDDSAETNAPLESIEPTLARIALTRRSLILVGSKPAVLVSEWFTDTLLDTLATAGW